MEEHKTKIGGTNYNIIAGKTKIGGTNYNIKEGKTLIGGTVKTISFKPNFANPTFLDPPATNTTFIDTPIYINGYYYALWNTSAFQVASSTALYTSNNLTTWSNKGAVGSSNQCGQMLAYVNNILWAEAYHRPTSSTEMNQIRIYYGTPSNGSITWNTLYWKESSRNDGQTFGNNMPSQRLQYYNSRYYDLWEYYSYAAYFYLYPVTWTTAMTLDSVTVGKQFFRTDDYTFRNTYLLNNKYFFLPYYYNSYTYLRYLDVTGTDYSTYSSVRLSAVIRYPLLMFYYNSKYYLVGLNNSGYLVYTYSTDGVTWSNSATTINSNLQITQYQYDTCTANWIDNQFIFIHGGSTLSDSATNLNSSTATVITSKNMTNFETYTYDNHGYPVLGTIRKDSSKLYILAKGSYAPSVGCKIIKF